MARAFRDLGHEVTVLASRTSTNTPEISLVEGIPVHRLLVHDFYRLRQVPGLRQYVRPVQLLSYSRRVDQAIRQLHRAQRVDVVEFAEVGAEGFFYARKPEVPVVVRCHTPTFLLARYYSRAEMPGDNRILAWAEKDLIRRAHARTTPSCDLARIIASECGMPEESIAPIPNALSVDEFAPGVPQASSDTITVLHVGRLERIKGVETLAQAIPEAVQQVPNVRFIFIGEDRPTGNGTSQRAELEKRLMAAGVGSQVEFLGKVNQTTLLDWYRRADICVVPSMLYESFSYTVAQGMAAAKPVVASRVGGIPETLDEGASGVLVEPGNAAELAQGIVRLACDPALRAQMGRAGQVKARREFDPVRVAERTLEIYERARQKFLA